MCVCVYVCVCVCVCVCCVLAVYAAVVAHSTNTVTHNAVNVDVFIS